MVELRLELRPWFCIYISSFQEAADDVEDDSELETEMGRKTWGSRNGSLGREQRAEGGSPGQSSDRPLVLFQLQI